MLLWQRWRTTMLLLWKRGPLQRDTGPIHGDCPIVQLICEFASPPWPQQPMQKLSVHLIRTYTGINTAYYAAKRKWQAQQTQQAVAPEGGEESGSGEVPPSVEEFGVGVPGPPSVVGLPEFHEIKGDSEVAVEPWSGNAEAGAEAAGGIVTRLRSFRFRTPIVGSPIGPPSTRATKTQRWRCFGPLHGSVLDTVTVLEDIPFGDCFEVDERWVVRPVAMASDLSGPCDVQGVEYGISFEVRWIKGTMWKRTIEAKTAADMHAFFKRWLGTMRERLAARDQTGTPAQQGAGAGGGAVEEGAAVKTEGFEAAAAAAGVDGATGAAPGDMAAAGDGGGIAGRSGGLGPWWLPWALALALVIANWRAASLIERSAVAAAAAGSSEMAELRGLLKEALEALSDAKVCAGSAQHPGSPL